MLFTCAQTDPELFFPGKGESNKARQAINICQNCPVKPQCLTYAIDHNITDGLWGGLTPQERKGHNK